MSPVVATALWAIPLGVAVVWRPRQAPSPAAWALLVAFGALGAWAVWIGVYAQHSEPPGFAFLKPTIFYWTLATVMGVGPWLGWDYPAKIIVGTYFALSKREWRWINSGLTVIYAVMGAANLLLASRATYNDWVGYKYSLMMNLLIIVLFRLNFVWLPILADVTIYLYRRATAAYRYLSNVF
jgi:intracellular septation protein A